MTNVSFARLLGSGIVAHTWHVEAQPMLLLGKVDRYTQIEMLCYIHAELDVRSLSSPSEISFSRSTLQVWLLQPFLR